jgi:DNA polymerase III epsilon subunit family exonuclease
MFRFIDAGPALQSLDAHTVFVAFDLETTGLDPRQDRITEIGAVRFTLQASTATFESLIDPGRPISSDAARVSGITEQMVRGKPRIGDMIGPFLDFVGTAALIAHNARFDGGFLRAVLKRIGRPLPPNPLFDTRLMTKVLWPMWPGYSLAKVLATLCLPHDNPHRALGDAVACRDVFLACLGKIGEKKKLSRRVRNRIAIELTEDDVDETV